jgi:sulfur-oxidizing protein SoxZ
MAEPMKIRAQMAGDKVEVRVLVKHVMETGLRRDPRGSGGYIGAWFIQSLTATHNGRAVLTVQMGPAVSKDPFLSFRFAGGKPGDKVQITWTDNHGEKRTDETTVA